MDPESENLPTSIFRHDAGPEGIKAAIEELTELADLLGGESRRLAPCGADPNLALIDKADRAVKRIAGDGLLGGVYEPPTQYRGSAFSMGLNLDAGHDYPGRSSMQAAWMTLSNRFRNCLPVGLLAEASAEEQCGSLAWTASFWDFLKASWVCSIFASAIARGRFAETTMAPETVPGMTTTMIRATYQDLSEKEIDALRKRLDERRSKKKIELPVASADHQRARYYYPADWVAEFVMELRRKRKARKPKA